ELTALGWIAPGKRPRMVSVQSDGCAPIVRGFQGRTKHADPFPHAHTVSRALRVPAAVGDFMILDAIRSSHGTAIAVDERRLNEWLRLALFAEGMPVFTDTAG